MKSEVLSTRQVAQLLGVGEATVKRWADAGEIDCFRTPGGHRKFPLRDVTGFVQKRNYQVSGGMQGALAGSDSPAEATSQMEKLALSGDAGGCVALISALRLGGQSLAEVFDRVVAPALHRVGSHWQEGHLSAAEEHVATGAVIDAIARSQPLAEPPGEPNRAGRGTAVVAAVAGEQHDVASRMAACLLRACGFEVLAPLAQTPARDLAEMIVRARARLVALASTAPAGLDALQEQVDLAAEAVRMTNGQLFLGGPGMESIKRPPGSHRPSSMSELLDRVPVGQLGERRAKAGAGRGPL